ncbi:AI-2E family transporter [Pseudalkalibacillus salsuginis]|uniref:AI-2E family transporter n=1 Tax=Pseudalkalibacillus salsuginis TaxID=2910972 RepID=UPI001F221234|nr:AI-2E family transporter [Pseudalkalibacillus salsuginis]MCF6408612.1 AI-2E family transporter [Pseudalkalibacillus salsuginis]
MKKLFTIEALVRLGMVLLALLCAFVLMKLKPFWDPILDILLVVFLPFFVALFITYLLHPIVEWIHRRGIPRSIAILIIYLTFFGGIGFLLFKSIPYLIAQLKDLSDQLPYLSETYRTWVMEFYEHTDNLPEAVHIEFEKTLNSVEKYLKGLIAGVLGTIKGFWRNLFAWVVIPFLVFYMLKDFKGISRAMWNITPKKWQEPGKKIIDDVDVSLGNYIRGQLTVACILAVLAIASFWIVGIPYPIILGIIIGVTDFIPYFGPILGAVPVTLIAATISVNKLLIVIGIIIILQFIEGNILGPLIVGKTLHIHPIGIIFALLIGGEIGGIVGLLLAVPLFAVGKVIFHHAREHFRNVDNAEN